MKNERVIDVFPCIDLKKFALRSDGNDPIVDNSRFYNYASGRSAIYHGVLSLEMPPNSVVLMPSYHCGVEVEAVVRAGYRVEFYHLKKDLSIDLKDVESRIGPQTKALFAIHYYGFPQDITKLKSFCYDANLLLVEDCSHAMYSKFSDEWVGFWGDIGVYSQRKVFGQTNGGGLIVNGNASAPSAGVRHLDLRMLKSTVGSILKFETGKQNLFGKAARHVVSTYRNRSSGGSLNSKGEEPVDPRHYYNDSRYDYHHAISPLSSFFQNRTDYKDIVKKRRANYAYLGRLIEAVPEFRPVFNALQADVCPLCYAVYHEDRNWVVSELDKRKILTYAFGKYSHPLMRVEDYPESSEFTDKILGLPIQQQLDPEDIEFVADALKEISKE